MSSMPAVRNRVVTPTIDGRTEVRPVINIQAVSRAARTFTGDFYFTHRNRDRLWIALGDVAGKGLPAAIVIDRKSTRLNSSHRRLSRMPSSA